MVFRPPILDRQVLPLDIADFVQTLAECRCEMRPSLRRSTVEESDHRHSRLLPARRKRPRSRRATEQRDELAAPHSITSSARASRVAGTSRPSALAAFRLMISSYLVGACTGRSAGFSPLRM